MHRKWLREAMRVALWLYLLSLLQVEAPRCLAGDSLSLTETDFKAPPASVRPLQYIPGFDTILAPGSDPSDSRQSLDKALRELRDDGLGGVVTNISLRNYLRDERQWGLFGEGLDVCRKLGMRVWIYDEDGYPSGGAGGLVLKQNPSLEAQELILDSSNEKGYRIRAAYEGTHASNNYYAARRYPNVIDTRAVDAFIAITHEAYARHRSGSMAPTVEAFFTDEPSLIAFNAGQIPEKARKNVPIRDPEDPSIKRLPSVPWVDDLPKLFHHRYGYELLSRVPSLFGGNREEDKHVRRDYWALVSEMVEKRYFGRLRDWCAKHKVASSGHCLGEESLSMHPALNGNLLRNLQQMQIPGIDVLSSDPSNAFKQLAFTATLASSAALLNGTRRVMTETSDHSQRLNDRNASLAEMRGTAAWQFALGVTDFVLMYGREGRSEDEYRKYCDFVSRLGALLTPARRIVPVALYYPIYDMWTWYQPTAEPLRSTPQPDNLRKVVDSFTATFFTLLRAGHPVCLVDHRHLADARIDGRRARIAGSLFEAVVIPSIDEMPAPARARLDTWRRAGGLVIEAIKEPGWQTRLGNRFPPVLSGARAGCLATQFERDGAEITLLVNTTNMTWTGTLHVPHQSSLSVWHFDDGTITKPPAQGAEMYVTLQALETLAVVSKSQKSAAPRRSAGRSGAAGESLLRGRPTRLDGR